jgi:hypothetical protein
VKPFFTASDFEREILDILTALEEAVQIINKPDQVMWPEDFEVIKAFKKKWGEE